MPQNLEGFAELAQNLLFSAAEFCTEFLIFCRGIHGGQSVAGTGVCVNAESDYCQCLHVYITSQVTAMHVVVLHDMSTIIIFTVLHRYLIT